MTSKMTAPNEGMSVDQIVLFALEQATRSCLIAAEAFSGVCLARALKQAAIWGVFDVQSDGDGDVDSTDGDRLDRGASFEELPRNHRV